jgi:hypothetical protein
MSVYYLCKPGRFVKAVPVALDRINLVMVDLEDFTVAEAETTTISSMINRGYRLVLDDEFGARAFAAYTRVKAQ